MDPLVKTYLKTHSFKQLEDEHGVCARPDSRSGNKFSLNYDMILVKNGDPIAEQCRGMVIRTFTVNGLDDNWQDAIVGDLDVLAWPMNRFYNLGDPAAVNIDWSDPDLRVYEKLDGTMIVFYWDSHEGKWHSATRGVSEADLPIKQDDMTIGNTTFSGLFWTALEATYNESIGDSAEYDFDSWLCRSFDCDVTYVFELTTPYNRIVVKYDKPSVTLLAARHKRSGEEIPVELLSIQNVPRPKTWNIKSPSALEAFVNSADPAQLEGAVVCDSQFRRLKVKNKAWVLSSKAKDLVTVSRRSALLAIINGDIDDVIPLIDADIAAELERMRLGLRTYLSEIDVRYADFKAQSGDNRKTFAGFVMQSGDWTPAYFNMWEGKAKNAHDWVRSMAVKGKLSSGSLDVILSKIKQA